ncbi:tryptophan synthase subunit alpha [Kineosporia sp. J2-2]|uniref:Tryptophan synthase alpha chain n=1 Tax=Kineosporia corallincola TaxID=2835133 RepID=A0ABS5TRB2_9ACTN|nr:tryptophan synthase subunit alpha [Kineosporia corallincola]MBT0773229.1 tryptophan synthase subunit alpha [Kineosporia corallincola]
MNILEKTLRTARDGGRKLLVPYVTGGITADWTDQLLAFQEAGADAIEVGLPFSDPMLDGPTIQRASDQALARGTTLDEILAGLAAIRDRVRVPLVAMTYANLVVRQGYREFCGRLAEAGVAGLIVPDLPLDELDGLGEVADAAGIDLVLLAAPSTTPERMDEICRHGRGFVYAVSVMGTTGERSDLAATGTELAAAVTARTDLPVLIGFGVSSPEHAVTAATTADGVVVASALMRRVLEGSSPAEVAQDVAAIRRALDAAVTSAVAG